MNTFEKIYQKHKAADAAYAAAKTEEEKAAAYAMHNEGEAELEQFGNAGYFIWHEYCVARDNGNGMMDFNGCVFEEKVPELVRVMREAGVEMFTYSSGFSGTPSTAMAFQKNGCRLEGMMEIYGDPATAFRSREVLPAFVFKVNP